MPLVETFSNEVRISALIRTCNAMHKSLLTSIYLYIYNYGHHYTGTRYAVHCDATDGEDSCFLVSSRNGRVDVHGAYQKAQDFHFDEVVLVGVRAKPRAPIGSCEITRV